MDAGAVAAALEEARFDARQASRYEDLADDLRGPAEHAERERIAQLLAAAGPGAVYDPDVDDVVQAELAADTAAAAREAELREAVRIATRANHLQVLRDLGTLDQAEPAEGDEAVRDELTRRTDGYVQADVDTLLAHALATHRRHCRDPAAREAAGLLTPRSSPTPPCSANSCVWSPAPTPTSWRSRPGSPPPSPKPSTGSPCFSPEGSSPGPSRCQAEAACAWHRLSPRPGKCHGAGTNPSMSLSGSPEVVLTGVEGRP